MATKKKRVVHVRDPISVEAEDIYSDKFSLCVETEKTTYILHLERDNISCSARQLHTVLKTQWEMYEWGFAWVTRALRGEN